MITTSWRSLIADAMKEAGDDGPLIAVTLSEEGLDRRFDDSYGLNNGRPFTAWTAKRVYFPASYDGQEWVASAPRDPCDEATPHVGGGG